MEALRRLEILDGDKEQIRSTIEMNRQLYLTCQNSDQLDILTLKNKAEELISNGATNDYLASDGSTALDWFSINKS